MAELTVTGIGVVMRDTPAQDGPWFDPRARLGARGYKYLPPACQYLLAAARTAGDPGDALAAVPAECRGVAVGTNGALTELFDQMDRQVTEGHADDLSPVTAPYFATNVTSNRLSVDLDCTGFSLTFTSPRVAGLEAIQHGARALATGRCARLVVAVAEHGAEQGAVVLLCAPPGTDAGYGSCFARTGFVPPRGLDSVAGRVRATEVVTDLLSAVDGQGAVRLVVDDSPVGRMVAGAVRAAGMPDVVPRRAGSLAAMASAAELLAAGAAGVVVVASEQGNVAVAGISGTSVRREQC
jgi:3-oxoacyl-[acyl-carrier-protein] synthase II